MAVESDGRRALTKIMKKQLGCHVHAVESGDTAPGIPDIEFCHKLLGQAWIEVKRLPAWPKRASTAIRLPKGYLKRAQVGFMKRRLAAGGTAAIALQIEGRDWFLLGPCVLELYNRADESIAFDQTWIKEHAVRLSGPRGLNREAVWEGLEALAKGRVL